MSLPSTKSMGTIIESMLGSTALHCPERTHEVVGRLMKCIEKSNFGISKSVDCCAIKVGKPKARVQFCLNKPVTRSYTTAAATKDTLHTKHPLAERRNKAVTEVATPISQQKPKEQKHARQPKKRRKNKRSKKLLGVQGGIRKQ